MAQAVSRHLSSRRPGSAPMSVHVGFVKKVALGQLFIIVRRVSPIIPPWLSIGLVYPLGDEQLRETVSPHGHLNTTPCRRMEE
jgi:hypothetical protein